MKNKLLTLLSLLLTLPALARDGETSLDGKWQFRTDPYNRGVEEKWYDTTPAGWDVMDVPGNWNTRMEYSDYSGSAWYATEFITEGAAAGESLLLYFESVYFDATVWLNGHLLGTHGFGYTGFNFDITDHITPDTVNRLVLRVDNSYKIGATWNWGGIRRPVTLRSVPTDRVERILVTARPDLKKGSAEVLVQLLPAGTPTGKAEIVITDPDGRVVVRAATILDGGSSTVTVPLKINYARLWNFNTPNLYTARVTLENTGRQVVERFGIRKIEVDGLKLLINGVEARLNGANWVPDDRFTGNTLPEDIYKRDIDLMKQCGVNMARLSHLALPKDVLDYLDEKGILIFEEIPLWNKNKYVTGESDTPLEWLSEVILERYNHPCIIGWSAGNEIGRLTDNPAIGDYLQRSLSHIRSLDPTRLAVYVTHTLMAQDWEPVLLSDMILYNQYGRHGERAGQVHERYPGKPLFYAEYGSKVNSVDPDNNITDYRAMMDDMSGREYLIGASVWTFNDYRTNYRDASTDVTGNRPWGVVDVYRRKKRGFDILRSLNSPLAMFEMTTGQEDGRIALLFGIQARAPLEIPSYAVARHTLRLDFLDANGNVSVSETVPLPVLHRGSTRQDIRHIGPPATGVHNVRACLVSPTGYEIDERRQFLAPPSTPSVEWHDCSDNSIRVYFDRHPSATEWYVSYNGPKGTHRSEATINDHITITGLDHGTAYRVTLVAVNNAGETKTTQELELTTVSAELPPAIYHLALRGDNVEVGYEAVWNNLCFEFLYSTSPDFTDPRQILTTEFGSVNLPAIEPGSVHYLKIRKRLHYGYESPWSRVYKVTPGL